MSSGALYDDGISIISYQQSQIKNLRLINIFITCMLLTVTLK